MNAPPPSLLTPGLARMATSQALLLRSGEAALLCTRGVHVAGHPAFCPEGCVLSPDERGVAAAVLPYKRHQRLWPNERPLIVEESADGLWLLDGHHRLAFASSRGLPFVWVRRVSGQLSAYQARWAHIAQICRPGLPG